MSLLTKRTVMLARTESAYGEDALEGLPEDEQFQNAVAVFEADFNDTNEEIDRQLASGDLGQDVTPVGHGEATIQLSTDFRGSGATDLPPEWGRLLKACAVQSEAATVLALDGITIKDLGALPARMAGSIEKFVRGDLLFGAVELAAATWDTEAGNGDGLGTVPSVGDTVYLWPANGDEADPKAVGTLRAISGTTVLIQLSFETTARPADGWNLRANAPGGGAVRGYQALAEDMPIAVTIDMDPEGGNPDAGTMWCWVAQGTFLDSMEVVAHKNDVLAVIKDTDGVSSAGIVYRPDSERWTEATLSAWSGTTPPFYVELQGSADGTAPVTVHTQLMQGLGSQRYRFREFFGSVKPGQRLVDVTTTLSSAVVQASPAPIMARGPALSMYSIKDGFQQMAVGCRGNAQVELESGNPGRIRFDFMGSPKGELMRRAPQRLTFPSTVPPNWKSGIAHLLGYPLRTLAASFDLGNNVVRQRDANANQGTAGFVITERDPTLSITVERAGHKGWQFEEARRNGTWRCAGLVVGKSVGNRLALAFPRIQITAVQPGNENGIETAQLTCKPRRLGGDDEWLLLHR